MRKRLKEIIELNKLYDTIFKRKSFRRFKDALTLSEEELQYISQKIKNLIE